MTGGSGVYLYCIGGPDHPAPGDVAGVDGAPVRAMTTARFTLWVSDLDAPPGPSLDRVRAHNRVVEAACATATPLPSRFGQWFESRDHLADELAGRVDHLAGRLDAVDGALEHGVRVVDPAYSDEPPARSSGTAYLESLARRSRMDQVGETRGRDVATALRSWLGPLVRDARVDAAGRGTLVAIAFLVGRHDTGNYDARVRRFPPQRPELEFLFTGPWPPYGFVE